MTAALLVLSLCAAPQDVPRVPFPAVWNSTGFEVFQIIDGMIHQRAFVGDYEQVEGTTTILVEEIEDGKPVVRTVKAPKREWRQRVVLRPVPAADATFKTAGGDLLTYKQAVARIADRAACLSVYGDEPVDPLVLKALKPETVIVRWTAKAVSRGT